MPPDGTTLAYNFLRVSTSHFVRKCRGSAGFFANESRLEKYIDATETFSADRHDVSVWELISLDLVDFRRRFELCFAIRAKAAQFLFDIPHNLPHCGSSERVPSLSEVLQEILCKITAMPTNDGVM